MELTLDSVVLRLKRADTPFFKSARRALDCCLKASVPVPRSLKPAGRFFYELRFYFPILWKRFKSLVYTTPVFSCRCESVGKHLQLWAMPVVSGHALLYLGDEVRLSGSFAVASGKFSDHPTLRIGNRAFIGHNVSISCNREVTIEDDVLIAEGCQISDYDGHPGSFEKRIANSLPDPGDIRPVRICKGAWVGKGVFIFKGVTVGAGSIVGANSVVTHDVEPYTIVAGSPAKVVRRVTAPNAASVVGKFAAAA